MGRVSVKQNKNLYQVRREELGLSREKASELLESIPPERIEKIENQKSLPHPEEVLVMADAYKTPNLCNYYCANDCPIGKQYVPEIEMKDLSQIVLEMLASLNAMRGKQERLIEITVDGIVDGEEIKDFVHIQDELEKISITVETLQLWAEQMLAENKIDVEAYHTYKNSLKEK
ncbi:MAG: helix-turn-helix transcriptional regulator [Lachnospiraceae bacterium]|nr:helix-turn-helix transcriptional regulator [Lachnospiraceae bacterium]